MRRLTRIIAALGLALLCLGYWNASPRLRRGSGLLTETATRSSVLDYVRPLIGTTNGGHVFPGSTLPYGLAKAVADTQSPAENAAGYVSDEAPVIGFSQLHDSGTGGIPSLGNFPLFAHPGCPENNFTKCHYSTESRMVNRVRDTVVASPGYFSIELENGVRAEMTSSSRTNLFRLSFTQSSASEHGHRAGNEDESAKFPLILIDLQDISKSLSEGEIEILPNGRIVGQGTFRASFGKGMFMAYFCADTQGPPIKATGTFVEDSATTDKYLGKELLRTRRSAGAWIQFDNRAPQQILVRVGMSFISTEQACSNAKKEVPDFDFQKVQEAARREWKNKLDVIEVDATGVDGDLQTSFWSGLYRSFLMPQNYTGENQLWESAEPYFDSFYCIWDSFRAQHPLLTILDPSAQREMIRSLLDIYRHVGYLPDCRMSFCKGFSQGGSNADVVIADAFVKNLTEGIDWKTAYDAVLTDAETTPKDWSLEGRGNIESWATYGYIAQDHQDTLGYGPHSRTISRTFEYAYDDFCIATLAEGLGEGVDAKKYLNRSGFWKNVWNPKQQDLIYDPDSSVSDLMVGSTFVGFPQPRLTNGKFMSQMTRTCSPVSDMHRCYFDTSLATYEGSPWLYSFYVPQDMQGLIDLQGGDSAFVERLEYFHTSGIAYMGNEPTFLTIFQFHYAGRPGKSSEWVRNYIPSHFNNSINGIPGNDDCAMGAFNGMAMMGFFPVAGQSVYLLTAPFFPEVKIQTRSDRPAIIRRRGDPKGIYIQSVTLDGENWNRSWITHDFFLHGGTLELMMGSKENEGWGVSTVNRPPSYSPLR